LKALRNIPAVWARGWFVLLATFMVAGGAMAEPRDRFLEPIAPEGVANLQAYCAGNTLEMVYPAGSKETFAHATWNPGTNGDAEYQYATAILSPGQAKHAVRKALILPGNRLVVRNATQWQGLLHQVLSGLAPDQPQHGILFLVQYMEMVVFRDADGSVKVVKLESKPPEVVVDKTYGDADFAREAIRQLAATVSKLDSNQSRFLFLTGEAPAFALVDVHERALVFVSYPADPEAAPVDGPVWFALRAVNSLLIKSVAETAIKNPFTLISRGFWHLGNSGMTIMDAGSGEASHPPPPLYTGPGMNLGDWEKELDGLVSARRYQGKVQLFIDGDQFFPALIQSLENARHSIEVMVYIFCTDDYAIRIADVLKERSAAVRVRVLLDDVGCLFAGHVLSPAAAPPDFPRPDDIQTYLEAGSHVQVRANADPWLSTDHRKCIIIDDRQAYIGGMNIGAVYRYQWHDLMIGLTGPIVGRLDKDYRKAWAFAGPLGDFGYAWASLFDREEPRKNAITGGIEIRPLRTATGKLQIYRAQLAAIRRSKRYIYLESAYFNDDKILRELILARQRGVDVRVILPAENDIGIMQTCNLVMANEMVRNGIRVYAYPGMSHVKAAIYDGWACVGSANLEKMSLRVSQELDAAFSDPATVDRLREDLFEADFKHSQELKSPVASDWLDALVKAFANQL
jgi:cardiolipin synthase